MVNHIISTVELEIIRKTGFPELNKDQQWKFHAQFKNEEQK